MSRTKGSSGSLEKKRLCLVLRSDLHLWRLLHLADSLGFEKTIIVVINSGGKPRIENPSSRITVYRLPRIFRKESIIGDAVTLFFGLNYIIRKHGIDIIHFFDYPGSACLLFKQRGVRYIMKWGGDLVFEYMVAKGRHDAKEGIEASWHRGMVARAVYSVQKALLKKSDYVLPNSNFGAKLLKRIGVNENKIRVVVNGINLDEFRGKNDHSGKLTVTTTARLVKWKGIDVLIKAASLAVKGGPDVRFVIIGDGPEKERLVGIVKSLGIEDHVDFTGKLPRREVIRMLVDSDIFILPSYFDSTSNALLEAMAAGNAVIVSDYPGNAEVIEEGVDGLVFRMGDHKQLASKLDLVIKNQEFRKRLQETARRKIRDVYSWKNTVGGLVRVYKEALDNG